ncbi:hypothetical protein EH223_07935 [candidate division KSB1 bacterium]|nr:hypothetical protein [candidate division KSB1 bacterium]RQW04122.1 MAG: hypothetical protein EH223_07935 [candidate division KSB1 bacterium]
MIPDTVSHGIYLAPSMMSSQLGRNQAVGLFPGLQIGWILNERFTIGLKTNQLWSNIEASWIAMDVQAFMNFSYSGIFFSYTPYPRRLVHIEIYTLGGCGLAGYRTQKFGDFDNVQDGFMILEPGIVLEMNLTHFLRTGLGLSYSIVRGIQMEKLSERHFNGMNLLLLFKVGLF